jgi:polyhydroxyalkanoate synthesis regulator phasin
MQPYLRDYHQQAVELQGKLQDSIDRHGHPMADMLQREVHELVQDIHQNKHPRDLEHRIKTIQHTMLQAQNDQQTVMTPQEVHDLHHQYERLRQKVRSLPNY